MLQSLCLRKRDGGETQKDRCLMTKLPSYPFLKRLTLKLSLLPPQLTCLSRKYFLGLQNAKPILCLTAPRLLTEHGYQQSKPGLELQIARISRLSNQPPHATPTPTSRVSVPKSMARVAEQIIRVSLYILTPLVTLVQREAGQSCERG